MQDALAFPSLLAFLLFISTFIQDSLSYPHPVSNGYQVYDLAATSNYTFDQEAQGWSVKGLIAQNRTTVCNGLNILGGPGVLSPTGYFERFYNSLPGHDIIYFRIGLFFIDDWRINDTVIVQIADHNFTIEDIASSVPDFPSDLCGDPNFADLDSFHIMGKVNHTMPNVTMRIIPMTGRSSSFTSLGIRKVNLLFANKTAGVFLNFTDIQEDNAVSCNLADIPILTNNCTCPTGTYQDPTDPNICLPCNGNCTDCFGPSASECYACNSSANSSFVKTECITCDPSCSDCSGPKNNSCVRCTETNWYKWDRTCLDTCSSPIENQEVQGDVKLCKEPCLPDELYYWNGTCKTDCPSPLNNYTSIFGRFCILPCAANSYRLFNKSCKSTCDYPLVKGNFQDIVLLCDKPCASAQYFYPDETCQSQCISPMVLNVQNSVDTCVSPCNSSAYYYELNDTCVAQCNSPNIIKIEAFFKRCIYVSTEEDIADGMIASDIFFHADQSLTMATAVLVLIGVSNPAVNTLAGFIKMLPYLKFIKVNYPTKLQIMLDNMNTSYISFNLGLTMSPELQSNFPMLPIPEKFEKYQLHSSFLVNYWDTLTSLLILLGVIILLSFVTYLTKNRGSVNEIFKGLTLIVRWNFFMMVFCTNLDVIILPTSLELRTLDLSSSGPIASFVMCILINIATVFVFGFAYYIIKDIRKNKFQINPLHSKAPAKPNQAHTKWREFQLFFKGSKEEKWIQHIFIVPYLLRICVFYFIISYLFDYPLAQAILIILLSLIMLFYLIVRRPFVSKLVFCQHTTDEILMFSVNLCLLILAIFDANSSGSVSTRNFFGSVIIFANLIFSFTANIYLFAYIFMGLKDAYVKTRKYKKRGILTWITAFLAPFEVGGMDLEVVEIKDETPNQTFVTLSSKIAPSLDISPSTIKRLSINTKLHRESFSSQNSFIRDHADPQENSFMLKDKMISSPVTPTPSSSIFENVSPAELAIKRKSTFGRKARDSTHLDLNKLTQSKEDEEVETINTKRSLFSYSKRKEGETKNLFD